ncbi:hypothetical protein [Lactobacillus rodentium]
MCKELRRLRRKINELKSYLN